MSQQELDTSKAPLQMFYLMGPFRPTNLNGHNMFRKETRIASC